MIKPIPKRLLPNSCIYKKYLGNTGEGDEWGADTPLKFVKVEEKTQLRVTSNGREIVGNARLFYDLTNSNGLNEEPVQNSKIIFNDKEYRVVDSDILRGEQNIPHHYEVLLK